MQDQDPTLDARRASTRQEAAKRICERFEGAWKAGQSPRLEDYLTEVPEPDRGALFSELLLLEWTHRANRGEAPSVEECRARFPDFADRVESVLAYVSAERTRPTTGVGFASGTPVVDPTDQVRPTKTHPPGREPYPATIGRYVVRGQLGTGSFGTVWLADDADLRRQVAIKVPRQDRWSNEAGLASFLHEARTAARLKHPAIVTIYDVGRLDDIGCFVVMEFIPGRSLAEDIRAGRPDFERSASLMEQVAEAVHYAHEQGLVHRDLKPANILIDTGDKPRVVDFGLAIHEEQRSAKRGEVTGTPAYMAPEQVRGESHRFDGRTDVWSLGVVIYELLAGRRPFIAPAIHLLFDEIQHLDVRPPRQFDDTVPLELERICLKCLAKRMTDRYATAADLAADLRHWQEEGGGGKGKWRGDTDRERAGGILTPIIPKGLRSFDSNDADFFLQLLPGPTDRDGLPESVRFWKTRIEETDPDRTFPVGLLYGPSGCGKSSLFKAGLVPRLARHVTTVYIEASAQGTEERLLSGLRGTFGARDLPAETIEAGKVPAPIESQETPATQLVDAVAALRFQRSAPDGRKVLIVLDQFEQWLHAHRDGSESDLVRALRQCDGACVQCVVMVRDDFWLAASRFMQALEIPLVEGRNSALADLFDAPHARKVLALFGRAHGRLGNDSAGNAAEAVRQGATTEPTSEQAQFLDAAVAELAENGKVVPVRLALFAEMVKARPWSRATLKTIGGIAGVGATFLEETFSASTSQPRHRRHQRAARAVLKALLPESVTELLAVEVFARSSGRSSGRSPAERRVLRAAHRRHGLRAAAAAAILALVALAAHETVGRIVAGSLVEQLLRADTPNVPETVAELATRRRQAEPLLRAKAADPGLDATEQLHVSLALLRWDAAQLGPLRARLLSAEPRDLPIIRDALRPYQRDVVGPLWRVFDDPASEPSARLRSACALAAYDPENARWPAIAGGVAETLTAEDPLAAETWIDALLPVKEKLIAPLSSLFRDRGDERAAERSMAAAILPNYAADRPDLLADLAADADPRPFGALVEALKRHPDEATSHLEKVTAERAAGDWRDPPLDSTWQRPAQPLVDRIERAAGILTERFAFCQTMALEEVGTLAEALRPAGYRPLRVRPYVAGNRVLAAALWQRDGGEWHMVIGLSADEVRVRDRIMQAEGLVAVDVAGYAAAGDPAKVKFTAVWANSPDASRLEIESIADRPPPAIERQGYCTATIPTRASTAPWPGCCAAGGAKRKWPRWIAQRPRMGRRLRHRHRGPRAAGTSIARARRWWSCPARSSS